MNDLTLEQQLEIRKISDNAKKVSREELIKLLIDSCELNFRQKNTFIMLLKDHPMPSYIP